MKPLDNKVYKNVLITEKITRLTPEERQKIVIKLLAHYSLRELSQELGIPHSTLHDWKTLRQNNTGSNIHISFNQFYLKIKSLTPQDITDWGRLEQIRDVIDKLLNHKGV